MKKVLVLMMAAVAMSSFAATSTSTMGSLWTKLKASPFSASYDLAVYELRDSTGQVRGGLFEHYLNLDYKLTDDDALQLSAYLPTTYKPAEYFPDSGEIHNTYDSLTFRYQRSNILNDDDHGVSARYRFYYGHNNNQDVNQGFIENRLYVTRKLTPNFKIIPYLRHTYFIAGSNNDLDLSSSSSKVDTRKTQRLRAYLIPSYAIDDNNSIDFTLRYEQNYYKERAGSLNNRFQIIPTYAHTINDYQSFSVGIYYTWLKSNDNRTFLPYNQAKDIINYEFVYSITAF